MKVLVAISARPDQGRWIEHYQSMQDLELPFGSKVKYYTSWFSYMNKNQAVAEARIGGFTHIFFVDDDQILPPNTLLKLLEHDKDVVTCNLISRVPPFNPFLFDRADENGRVYCLPLTDQKGLIEILACGCGGILILTDIFDIIGPWAITEEIKTEDLFLCKQLRDKGFKIFCDLNTPSGHIAVVAVWPNKENGKWKTTVVFNNALRVDLPAAQYNEEGSLTLEVTK